jgi:hypothetical protein
LNEPASGDARQRFEIEVALVAGVVAGDPAGQHSRVREFPRRIHQHELGVCGRGRSESTQHLDVAMAAAEQHQSFHAQGSGFYIPDIAGVFLAASHFRAE